MGLIFLLLLSIPASILQGFVISKLWFWFIAPLGIVNIGIAQAIGISLIVSLLTTHVDMARDPDMKGWPMLIGQVAGLLFIWGFGAIVHMFM